MICPRSGCRSSKRNSLCVWGRVMAHSLVPSCSLLAVCALGLFGKGTNVIHKGCTLTTLSLPRGPPPNGPSRWGAGFQSVGVGFQSGAGFQSGGWGFSLGGGVSVGDHTLTEQRVPVELCAGVRVGVSESPTPAAGGGEGQRRMESGVSWG